MKYKATGFLFIYLDMFYLNVYDLSVCKKEKRNKYWNNENVNKGEYSLFLVSCENHGIFSSNNINSPKSQLHMLQS